MSANEDPPMNMVQSNLPIAAAKIKKAADPDDNLCTFCGEWATKGSSCSNRYEGMQCYDENLLDSSLEIHMIYACDKCIADRNMLYLRNSIVFPCGTVLLVDAIHRIND